MMALTSLYRYDDLNNDVDNYKQLICWVLIDCMRVVASSNVDRP